MRQRVRCKEREERPKKLTAAYYLLADDGEWAAFKPESSDYGRSMILYDEEIDRGEIPSILSEWGYVVSEYFRYKTYGSPYGGGYLQWPCNVLDVFDHLNNAEGKRYKILHPPIKGK